MKFCNVWEIDLCPEGAISAPDARYSRRDETCLCFVLFWITTVRGRNQLWCYRSIHVWRKPYIKYLIQHLDCTMLISGAVYTFDFDKQHYQNQFLSINYLCEL